MPLAQSLHSSIPFEATNSHIEAKARRELPSAEEEEGGAENSTATIQAPSSMPRTISALTSQSPACNLSRYYSNWKNFISNSFILKIVKSGYIIQLNSRVDIPPVITKPSHEKYYILPGKEMLSVPVRPTCVI